MNIPLVLLVFGIIQIGMSIYDGIILLENKNVDKLVKYYIISKIFSNFISGSINIISIFFYIKYQKLKYLIFIINLINSTIGFSAIIIYYKYNISIDEIQNLLLIETLMSIINLIIFIIYYNYIPNSNNNILTILTDETIES